MARIVIEGDCTTIEVRRMDTPDGEEVSAVCPRCGKDAASARGHLADTLEHAGHHADRCLA